MPYAAAFDPETKPADAVIAKAKEQTAGRLHLHWIKPWNVQTGLNPEEFAAIKQTLANGWPVCGGFRWPRREIWQADLLQMCPPKAVFDGHSILIVGHRDDATQPGGGTLTFYNTNRPDTECRMTFEYALAYMNDALWIDGDGK